MRPGYHTAVKLLAFDNATTDEPLQEYLLRKIFRWYSKTFHTPLQEVEAIPLHDIFVHYWETRYEDMKEFDLVEERNELIFTEEERKTARYKKDLARLDDFLFEKEAEEEGVLTFKKPKGPKKGSLGAMVAKNRATGLAQPAVGGRSGSESDLPDQESTGDIKMTFMDLDEFESLSDADALGNDPIVGDD